MPDSKEHTILKQEKCAGLQHRELDNFKKDLSNFVRKIKFQKQLDAFEKKKTKIEFNRNKQFI